MAYQIYKFDDVTLPLYNSEQTHSPGERDTSLYPSVGGVYDYWSTAQKYPRIIPVTLSGWYVGLESYEVDEGGNLIVDATGNYIVSHGASIDLQIQVEALQKKIGKRSSLWRRYTSDATVLQWKTARLLRTSYELDAESAGCTVAEVSANFETRQPGWHAETQTTTTATCSTNVIALTVRNGGSMRIDDAKIIITGTGAGFTSVIVQYPGAGIDLRYTGTVTSGQVVTIDCDAGTVRRGATDLYSNFSLGSGHTARGWCPLAVGNNAFMVKTMGAGTVSVRHYNQHP